MDSSKDARLFCRVVVPGNYGVSLSSASKKRCPRVFCLVLPVTTTTTTTTHTPDNNQTLLDRFSPSAHRLQHRLWSHFREIVLVGACLICPYARELDPKLEFTNAGPPNEFRGNAPLAAAPSCKAHKALASKIENDSCTCVVFVDFWKDFWASTSDYSMRPHCQKSRKRIMAEKMRRPIQTSRTVSWSRLRYIAKNEFKT